MLVLFFLGGGGGGEEGGLGDVCIMVLGRWVWFRGLHRRHCSGLLSVN